MSIGKSSIARVANATAKTETLPEEQVLTAEEVAPAEAEPAPEKAQTPEKFKNVRVGDAMPAFLL
ncbi:MAG: hypothetical protein IJW21_08190 [Clostridia bacterium]|nr:hypothetical protein [Clostridia bacterium]